MAFVEGAFGIAFGILLVYGGMAELIPWLRARHRIRRATGVFVDRANALAMPGRAQRSGIFQFTTEDGRVFTGKSSFSSPRGPRVGKRVTIVYDPARPKDADVAWVKTFKLVLLTPVLTVAGLVLLYIIIASWVS